MKQTRTNWKQLYHDLTSDFVKLNSLYSEVRAENSDLKTYIARLTEERVTEKLSYEKLKEDRFREYNRAENLKTQSEQLQRDIAALRNLPWHRDNGLTKRNSTLWQYLLYKLHILHVEWRSPGVYRFRYVFGNWTTDPAVKA